MVKGFARYRDAEGGCCGVAGDDVNAVVLVEDGWRGEEGVEGGGVGGGEV